MGIGSGSTFGLRGAGLRRVFWNGRKAPRGECSGEVRQRRSHVARRMRAALCAHAPRPAVAGHWSWSKFSENRTPSQKAQVRASMTSQDVRKILSRPTLVRTHRQLFPRARTLTVSDVRTSSIVRSMARLIRDTRLVCRRSIDGPRRPRPPLVAPLMPWLLYRVSSGANPSTA